MYRRALHNENPDTAAIWVKISKWWRRCSASGKRRSAPHRGDSGILPPSSPGSPGGGFDRRILRIVAADHSGATGRRTSPGSCEMARTLPCRAEHREFVIGGIHFHHRSRFARSPACVGCELSFCCCGPGSRHLPQSRGYKFRALRLIRRHRAPRNRGRCRYLDASEGPALHRKRQVLHLPGPLPR